MSICVRCGMSFGCALLGELDSPCWCTQFPPIVPLPSKEAGCMCPGCLKMHIETLQRSPPPAPHD